MHEGQRVIPYDIDGFLRILADKPRRSPALVGAKYRGYFASYFSTIAPKTMVTEEDYVDRDFLKDFAGYYVTCFYQSRYGPRCLRIHFFSLAFGEADFDNLLAGSETPLTREALRNSYQGFIIVKPLPLTIIGRTCLETYPPDGGRRHFPTTRPYSPSLFGVPLEIKTLAFQEQDGVVAACATSALWSVFHATSHLFQHHVPSPIDITKGAVERLPLEGRAFPSGGLFPEQMAQAIRSVGLEPYAVSPTSEYALQAFIYAYLRSRIPVLMGMRLEDPSDPKSDPGRHAVAVVGYSLGKPESIGYGPSGFLLRASQIDKIYVHDDQIGPFARMEFAAGGLLRTSWPGALDVNMTRNAFPEILLFPLYHKIRIPFQTIHDSVVRFDKILEDMREGGPLPFSHRFEWDIYLSQVRDFKEDLFNTITLDPEYRRSVLSQSMPRFLWVATALSDGERMLDLLFDTTDIEQGKVFLRAVEHDSILSSVLRFISRDAQFISYFETSPEWRILDWFSHQPLP